MDFEKKYPITQQPGDFLRVQWLRGYKKVDVYYKDELVGTVEGAARLKKGVRLVHAVLGNIDLKLSESPVVLDVIVDGYHSPVNVSHPLKQMKQVASVFWAIFTFAIIGAILEGIKFSASLDIATIVTIINLLIVAVYGVAAYQIGKGRPWGYYMGFSVFTFMTLLSLLALLNANFFVFLMLLIRAGLLLVLIINMKHVLAATKHLRYGKPQLASSDDLLDTKI